MRASDHHYSCAQGYANDGPRLFCHAILSSSEIVKDDDGRIVGMVESLRLSFDEGLQGSWEFR